MEEKIHNLELKTRTNELHIEQVISRIDSYKNDLTQQIADVKQFVRDDNELLVSKLTNNFREEARILADGLNKKIEESKDKINELKSNQKWYSILAMAVWSAVLIVIEYCVGFFKT